MIEAIDLFCGAGGLTRGLNDAGIRVVASVDNDAQVRHAIEANNPGMFLHASVADIRSHELARLYTPGAVRVLAGCAPCQAFSALNPKAADDDPRKGLMRHFARLVAGILPDYVVCENVPAARESAAFAHLSGVLAELGYHVDHAIVKCSDYGAAQTRRRTLLLASRHGPISIPGPTGPSVTVRDVIGHLPEVEAGAANPSDPLHVAQSVTPLTKRRIMASKPGGTWKDWPQELWSSTMLAGRAESYQSVRGRMSWDAPGPTMTTQFFNFGSGRFGHPEQHRALTLREGALLQGFPTGYEFTRPDEQVALTPVGRMIGNAVPLAVARALGQAVVDHDVSARCGTQPISRHGTLVPVHIDSDHETALQRTSP